MPVLFFDEWWNALAGVEKVFWAISIIFSVLFFIQFVLSLIGIDFDTDTDFEGGGGVDGLDGDFTILSVRSIIAFFTFFGWAGVLIIGNGGGLILALGIGTAAGFASMFVVGYVMYMFSKLQDGGSVLQIEAAIHETAEVYLPIPPNQNGTGKVQIVVNGTFREMEAMTDGAALPTGSKVRVTDIINDTILLVELDENNRLLN